MSGLGLLFLPVLGSCGMLPSSQQLKVQTSGGGSVRILNSGRVCSTSCSLEMGKNAVVQLQAVPDDTTVFNGWSGACSGNLPTCNVQMTTDQLVAASFKTVGADAFDIALNSTVLVVPHGAQRTFYLAVQAHTPIPGPGFLVTLDSQLVGPADDQVQFDFLPAESTTTALAFQLKSRAGNFPIQAPGTLTVKAGSTRRTVPVAVVVLHQVTP